MPVQRFETKQGFEGQFGTNHLGHFVLTKELLDLIEHTPNSRIVTLSSLAVKMKDADIYCDDLLFDKGLSQNKNLCAKQTCEHDVWITNTQFNID